MPNIGKPSRGCGNCKQRRIKCGEERPECRACVKTARKCPGYVDGFDLVLRDGTTQVKKKYHSVRTKSPAQTEKLLELPSTPVSNRPGTRLFPEPLSAFIIGDMPVPPIEDLALGFFLNRVVRLARDPRTGWGFMGFMRFISSTYSEALCDSSVSMATATFSLVIFSIYFNRKEAVDAAQMLFAKAVTMTQAAIRDPEKSKTNETLITVLLLALYEDVRDSRSLARPSGVHLNGAIALLKHRGPGKFNDRLSKVLASTVQAKAIADAFRSHRPITQSLNIWSELGVSAPQHPPELLGSLSVELPNLRTAVDEIMSSPYATDESIIAVLHLATRVDQSISQWDSLLPDSWKPRPIIYVPSPDEEEEYSLYQNTCDVYPDIWVANTWNSYRCSRIATQRAVLSCFSRLPQTKHNQENIDFSRATIQSLVDGICASVPFHVGIRRKSLNSVVYPYADDPSLQNEHIRTVSTMGRLLIFRSLEAVALDNLALRSGQREWVIGQLINIRDSSGVLSLS